MKARHILSLSFDRIDGGLLAPDPSNVEMMHRKIPHEFCFLETFDMDLDSESEHLELVKGFDEAAPAKIGTPQPQLDPPDTEGTKSTPPRHGHNSIRVYVAHGASEETQDDDPFIRDLLEHQKDPLRSSMGGYEGLSNQWEKIPRFWFAIPSFAVSKPTGTPRWLRFLHFKEFIASFRKITKEIRILEHEDHSLALLISIRTYNTFRTEPDSNEWIVHTKEDFIRILQGLQENYRFLLKKTEVTHHRKMIMMLWFANAQLVYMLANLKEARCSYQKLRLDTLEARKARLLPGVVDDIITDAYLHRELQNRAVDFAFMLESLLDTASNTVINKDFKANFEATFAHVRGLSSDLRRMADDIPRSLNHHLRLLEIRRNVQDSSNQWILTTLASIFLPLSLSCSLLSMQTRFRDLHYLLYDFCGVVVILLTLVALILLGLKVTMWLVEKVQDESRKVTWKTGRMILKRTPTVLMVGMFMYFLPVFLASFIVGMLQDVRLGGLILGYGLAGLVGVLVVISALTALVVVSKK